MKILKNIIVFILEIVLSLIICGIVLIDLMNSTILNEEYILAKLNETNYYDNLYEYVQSNFEKYIGQSGLDESIISNIITKENIKQDTEKILNNIYEGAENSISTEDLKKSLKTNIQNAIDDNQKIDSDSLEKFVDAIANEYLVSISSYQNYENSIHQVLYKINDILENIYNILWIAIVTIIVLLLLVNIKTKYKFITSIGVSFLSTGILFAFTNVYINKKLDIQNISVLNNSISEILQNILQNLLDNILQNSIIIIIIGLILIIIPSCFHLLKQENFKNSSKKY